MDAGWDNSLRYNRRYTEEYALLLRMSLFCYLAEEKKTVSQFFVQSQSSAQPVVSKFLLFLNEVFRLKRTSLEPFDLYIKTFTMEVKVAMS